MLNLLLAATLGGGCGVAQQPVSYGYSYGYAPAYYQPKVAYVATPYVAPTYQPTYPAPYNASLVGDYLRSEAQYKAQAEQNARIDTLIKLMSAQAERPAPQPQPQFAAPQPQFASPQIPTKGPPPAQFQAPPPPSPQYPMADVPPPPVAPSKPSPSFSEGAWANPSAFNAAGTQAMATVFRNKCATCHAGDADKGGGIKLLEVDGSLADIRPYAREILADIATGRMPKGGPKLAPDELYTVFAGIGGGNGSLQASSGFGR